MNNYKFAARTKYHLLKDRRILCYCEFGDCRGIPVFYSHATPGSRLEGALFHSQAAKQNFRIICVDRPGMGESAYLPHRKLLDYPDDIIELADELKIEKFGMIGWSGGGVYGLACGYAIPGRLLFNIVLAGYTSFREMSKASGYMNSRLDHVSKGLAKKHPLLFKLYFELLAISMKVAPGMSYGAFVASLNKSDKEIAKQRVFKGILSQSQKEAFKDGSDGVATDAAIHQSDWGFGLQQITSPIQILHGDEDLLVPVEFSVFNSAQIPVCQLHIIDGEGHLFPVNRMPDIFSIAVEEISRQNVFQNKVS